MPKIEPAVETITFTNLTIPGGVGSSVTQFLDLSQIASLLNRRAYRQGLNWAVGGFKFISSSGAAAYVAVSKLQNTWVVGASWQKALNKWLEQQNDAMEDAGAESAIARYRDFKIHMDQDHVDAGFGANLLPVNVSPVGAWEASQVVIPNDGAVGITNEYLMKMHGDTSATAKSIIGGYAGSRSRPQQPDPSTPAVETSWMNRMHDVGDNLDEVIDNARLKNRDLPYNQVVYPGLLANGPAPQIHDQSYLTATTIGGTTRLKGGSFPCGLIKFEGINLGEPSVVFTLQIDLIPGEHRGYLCEEMQEMN